MYSYISSIQININYSNKHKSSKMPYIKLNEDKTVIIKTVTKKMCEEIKLK